MDRLSFAFHQLILYGRNEAKLITTTIPFWHKSLTSYAKKTTQTHVPTNTRRKHKNITKQINRFFIIFLWDFWVLGYVCSSSFTHFFHAFLCFDKDFMPSTDFPTSFPILAIWSSHCFLGLSFLLFCLLPVSSNQSVWIHLLIYLINDTCLTISLMLSLLTLFLRFLRIISMELVLLKCFEWTILLKLFKT